MTAAVQSPTPPARRDSNAWKPYPAYKNSGVPWLGRVPKHWEMRPAFGAYQPVCRRNVGMNEKTVLSLSYGRIIVKPADKLHGLVPKSFDTYQIVDPGDIIVRTTDLQNDHTSLRVGMVQHRGIITSAYLCLRAQTGMDPDYGYQLLNTWDLTKAIYAYGSGLRQSLDFVHFKRMSVTVPPLSEQSAIVRFLDHQDRLIGKYIRAKQKLIALLTEQKQAIIQRAVTRGLNPDAKMKPSGVEWLGEIPEHWAVRRLKDVAKVQSGLTLGARYGNQTLTRRAYLRVANVQAGYLDLTEIKTVDVPASEAAACELQRGDVLMTEGGDIDKLGRGHVWNAEIPQCLHQNHIFAVRVNPKMILPQYLALLTGSRIGRDYFQSTAKQTTNLASTNSSKIRAFQFALPSIEEQRRILDTNAENLHPIDSALSRATRQIALMREYRTRMISDVVTGKVDVREPAAGLLTSAEMTAEDDQSAAVQPPDAVDQMTADEVET